MPDPRQSACDMPASLLRHLRDGSSQAWASLYDQFAPGLHRFAASCLSAEAETAEDIVVETLARAAQGIARFDPEKASLAAWLYGIARHCIQGELRRRTRRETVPAWAQVSFEDLPEVGASGDLAMQTAARLDAQRRLREAAGVLSERERELVTLSEIGELPVREIGRVVGRSEQATQMLLHRARQKVRRTQIEGRLLVVGARCAPGRPRTVSGVGDFIPYGRWFAASQDQPVAHLPSHALSFSPTRDEVAYHCRAESGVFRQPALWGHIWRANRDWSEAVNLTEAAGVGGMNWGGVWSPDGTLIAFEHWEPAGSPSYWPGEPWVMKADGSAACRVVPKEQLSSLGALAALRWSRDGSCLYYLAPDAEPRAAPINLDLWGRRVQLLPRRPDGVRWSPDGSRKAFTRLVRGKVAGELGHWRQLVVTKGGRSASRVAVEQFIPDAAVEGYRTSAEDRRRFPLDDARGLALAAVGPVDPVWSPSGDKIAFLAALPFDPAGPHFWQQVDAWVYDLVTRRLTRLTSEPHIQSGLAWL